MLKGIQDLIGKTCGQHNDIGKLKFSFLAIWFQCGGPSWQTRYIDFQKIYSKAREDPKRNFGGYLWRGIRGCPEWILHADGFGGGMFRRQKQRQMDFRAAADCSTSMNGSTSWMVERGSVRWFAAMTPIFSDKAPSIQPAAASRYHKIRGKFDLELQFSTPLDGP